MLHGALLTLLHSGEFPGALDVTGQARLALEDLARLARRRPPRVRHFQRKVAAAVARLSAALEGSWLSMAASKELDELERALAVSALRRRR
jgi:hypothetical protein